jgi:hypothetical protein
MKSKIVTILCSIFLLFVAVGILISILITGSNTVTFIKNAIDNLGGGFLGTLLFISIVIGIPLAIYGMFHPPQFLDDAYTNAPKIVQSIIGILLITVIGGLITAFVFLGK